MSMYDLGFQPLYRQVYTMLVRRIAEGAWRPAEVLPSEQVLAKELGVSQGTVRKALEVMATEKLVEKRQGKGTYVAEYTQERLLFQFFRLSRPTGERTSPTSKFESIKRRAGHRIELAKLNLNKNSEVIDIRRIRLIEEVPTLTEKIILPVELFPDIAKLRDLPNTLYSLYQSKYGISVIATHEEISADLANKHDAERLDLTPGTPLIHIDRIAVAIDGRHVEWRTSRCDTRSVVYGVTLR